MREEERVVFHDESLVRKKVFRAFIVFFAIFLFILSAIALFDLFSNLSSSEKGPLNTVRYYNYYQSGNNDKKVALTFDDGPDPIYTPELLSILDRYEVPATFFFIGEEAFLHPSLIREVHNRGYDIGNHTLTHSHKVHDSEIRMQWELAVTEYFLTVVTGQPPLFYRPPFLLDIGNDSTINPYTDSGEVLPRATSYHYIPVGADIDSKDWKAGSVEEIVARVEDGIKDGHIILMHDGGDHDISLTVKALPIIIENLKSRGYEFVSLGDLFIPKSDSFVSGIKFGDSGNDVISLQNFLHYEGYLEKNNIGGIFDEVTAFSLLQWKVKNNLLGTTTTTVLQNVFLDEESAVLMSRLSEDPRSIYSERNDPPILLSMSRFFVSITLNIITSLLDVVAWILLMVTTLIGFRLLFLLVLILYRRFRPIPRLRLSFAGNVSVIIPAYNESENIKATILSIIGNIYKVNEIIVVDDGSKDGTVEEVRHIMEKYPDLITLIRQENGGKASALNAGVKKATNGVIVTLDGDAIFASDAIGRLIAPLADPTIGACAGTVMTAESKTILDRFQRIEYITSQYLEKNALDVLGAIGVVPGPIGAWRKKAIVEAGGFSLQTVVEDQDMTLGIQAAGYKVTYVKEAISYTETPFRIRDFIKQRFRWVFGTYQCFWKYKGYICSRKVPFGFSFITLPNIALFGFTLPIFFPVIDILFIVALFLGPTKTFFLGYLLFTVFDMVYSSLSLFQKKKFATLIFLVPFQRLFYRVVFFYVIIKSYVKAIEGTLTLWNKVARSGQTRSYFEKQNPDVENALIGRA